MGVLRWVPLLSLSLLTFVDMFYRNLELVDVAPQN